MKRKKRLGVWLRVIIYFGMSVEAFYLYLECYAND